MMLFAGVVTVELKKLWRSRWIVFAVLFGLFLLLSVGLYGFYVYQKHRLSPPAATPWREQVKNDIEAHQGELTNLRDLKEKMPSGGRGIRSGVVIDTKGIDAAIDRQQQAIDNDHFLLDHDIAPAQAVPIAYAALFGLGGIIMFLLTRIFGWLAAELIASERSNRTMAILLSRPPSRDQVLSAKAVASFLVSLAVVVATFLIVYAMVAFVFGALGPVTDQIGVPLDGSKPLSPSNLMAMPIPVFVLMCIGGALLAILCVQGMGLLISVLAGRTATAIGITLALLFGAPLVSVVITGIIVAITGNQDAATFLNYAFFNVLAPVSSIASTLSTGGSSSQSGLNEFGHQVGVLAVWTVAFYGAAWLLFRRKQETG